MAETKQETPAKEWFQHVLARGLDLRREQSLEHQSWGIRGKIFSGTPVQTMNHSLGNTSSEALQLLADVQDEGVRFPPDSDSDPPFLVSGKIESHCSTTSDGMSTVE